MDNRKTRTVVYRLAGCGATDGAAMESRVREMFGDQLEHCFKIAVKGHSELPGIIGLERWILRKDIKNLLSGPGREVDISMLDSSNKCDWAIAVMVKGGGFLQTDEGLDAVIYFGQVYCNKQTQVSIPLAGNLISWNEWLDSVLLWDGFVETQFGNPIVFNVPYDTDLEG